MTSIPILNLRNYRSTILHLSWMNLKIKYRGSYLGLFWTAVEPTLLFGFLYILFSSIRITQREDFAIYLLIGITIYHAFSRGTQGGLESLRANASIMFSLNTPRELFPVVATTTASILMVVEIAVLFGLMPVFSFVPGWTIVLLPIIVVLLLALILGMSYLLSIASVYIKDIQPFWGFFVSALFFVTPIFWYLKDATGFALEIQKINPVGQLIELAHQVVFGVVPSISEWLYTGSIVIAILFIGYGVFRKLEQNIVDKL